MNGVVDRVFEGLIESGSEFDCWHVFSGVLGVVVGAFATQLCVRLEARPFGETWYLAARLELALIDLIAARPHSRACRERRRNLRHAVRPASEPAVRGVIDGELPSGIDQRSLAAVVHGERGLERCGHGLDLAEVRFASLLARPHGDWNREL